MAYEEIGSVPSVVLGGVDKKTGKKNPTEIEGYFLRVESRPNRFNPDKPQNFYVFRTETGDKGVYGKASIDQELKNARVGRMTILKDTGKTLDTGKGFPMRVFKAMQDPKNTIEVTSDDANPAKYANSGDDDLTSSTDDYQDDSGDQDLDADDSAPDETPPSRPQAPRAPAQAPSAERQRKVQELLGRNKRAS